ncbi:hypothetical protein SAMN05421759_103194 [Roseivivax lentus]|uniref:Cold shock protein, CspA family n=1 Tax=Roseivivax lentus TaxID=633194 RepID=A0A1N7LVL1_9RHOB|nr:hypothetical protein [Roseivivax lentus]SIS77834.1 hypothetical protein SAMN05421759_103194 [Roseivivax lentus]
MMKRDVYGVVLWANATKGTAVIWCEDQGDLAFVTPGEDSTFTGAEIDAGDLILCSVDTEDDVYRRACNLRRVEKGSHRPLPRMLVRQGPSGTTNVYQMQRPQTDQAETQVTNVA